MRAQYSLSSAFFALSQASGKQDTATYCVGDFIALKRKQRHLAQSFFFIFKESKQVSIEKKKYF